MEEASCQKIAPHSQKGSAVDRERPTADPAARQLPPWTSRERPLPVLAACRLPPLAFRSGCSRYLDLRAPF